MIPIARRHPEPRPDAGRLAAARAAPSPRSCRRGAFHGDVSSRAVSYRDDHEAALARIDALEAENARLEAEHARLRGQLAAFDRAPPRETVGASARYGARIGFSIVITLLILAGGALGVWGAAEGCRAATDSSWSAREVTGKLDFTGPAFGGTWALRPGSCVSGQRMSFYGVDLVDKEDPKKILRFLEDPAQGTLLKVNIPGTDTARFIARSDCKTWQLQLRPTNNYVNDIRLLDGTVVLVCASSDGSTVTGQIDFRGCR